MTALLLKQTRLAKLKRRRQGWLQCHLWLGLTLGLVLAIAGLTGSILVFWHELDAWLNPELRVVRTMPTDNPTYRPIDEIVAAARQAYPPGTQPGLAEFHRVGEDSTVMFFGRDMAKSVTETNVYNVFVNPYTAEVQGRRVFYDADNPFKHTLMGFVFKLHYALLMKDTARQVVGWISALLLVSVLTGLIVWWPLTGQWRKALTLKLKANPQRLNFDLHKLGGFYTALVLLAVLLSGVYLNLPKPVSAIVKQFSPASKPVIASSIPNEPAKTLSPGEILAVVDARYPNTRLWSLVLPPNPQAVYKVYHLDHRSLADHWIQERGVSLDQYSGKILLVEDATTGTAGDHYLRWQFFLHSGQAFGMTGRILVFITGLACPLLYVTGLIRWLQKRDAKLR